MLTFLLSHYFLIHEYLGMNPMLSSCFKKERTEGWNKKSPFNDEFPCWRTTLVFLWSLSVAPQLLGIMLSPLEPTISNGIRDYSIQLHVSSYLISVIIYDSNNPSSSLHSTRDPNRDLTKSILPYRHFIILWHPIWKGFMLTHKSCDLW